MSQSSVEELRSKVPDTSTTQIEIVGSSEDGRGLDSDMDRVDSELVSGEDDKVQ